MTCDTPVGFISPKPWKYPLYTAMYGAMSNANEVISNGILVSCPPSIFAISIENNTMTKQPKTPNAIPIIDADLNNFAISFCLFFVQLCN